MPSRREIFGLSYIEEVVVSFGEATQSNIDHRELAWAHNVLSMYFSKVARHPVVDRSEKIFRQIQYHFVEDGLPLCPYGQDQRPALSVDIGELTSLAERRRSVRSYLQQPVPRELLDRALEVAALSPSACNRQPIEFKIFNSHERASEIAALAGGTSGFADKIPCLVAIVGRMRAYPYERDRHVIYIDGGLAAMSFMFALETLGLASCPINWPEVRERDDAIGERLGLELDERVVMLVAVGRPDPDGLVPASAKQSLSLFRTYEGQTTSLVQTGLGGEINV